MDSHCPIKCVQLLKWFRQSPILADHTPLSIARAGRRNPLFLLPQGETRTWLCSHGHSSWGHGSNNSILARQEEEVSGWPDNIYLAVSRYRNAFDHCRCLLSRNRSRKALKSLVSFLVPVDVDGQAGMRPSSGCSCWGGSVCISACKEGGSCKFQRMVLANLCSRYVFIAVFAEESADLKRPVRRYSWLQENLIVYSFCTNTME